MYSLWDGVTALGSWEDGAKRVVRRSAWGLWGQDGELRPRAGMADTWGSERWVQ